MQPTEHKPKKDEELIAHIKQSLKTHEELYQQGAWERFNEMQQTKKSPFFWMIRVSGVAAILAICFTLLWYNTTNSPQNEQLAKERTTNGAESSENQSSKKVPIGEKSQQLANNQLVMEDTKTKKSSDNEKESITKQNEVVFAQQANEPRSQVAVNIDNSVTSTTPIIVSPQINNQQVIAQVEEKSILNTSDFLAGETQKVEGKLDKLVMNKKQKKWDLGLMLAPSFGSTRELNMGYGVSMSYNFSDRLSLNSGIAYNKMNASKNLPTNIGTSSIVLGNTKSLEMINEEITGLDIPIELKYQINKNVYANLGVSGFAVLNQNRRNTFVETVMIKSNANTTASVGGISGTPNGFSGSDGLEDQKGQFANSYLVNQRTTEAASASTIEDVNYIGFYNLSVGYTKKVYKNHALSIEPFVKLPIKNVTQDNLKLIGTGVRLKVGF